MNIVVLGGGESGVGAALLAKHLGDQVFLSDAGSISPDYKSKLIAAKIDFEEGQHSVDRILNADLVVKSPGIPDRVAIVQLIRSKGIELISEIEWAYRYSDAEFIGITGSNGKTTTSLLIHHVLKRKIKDLGLAGNIGSSLAEQVVEDQSSVYVLELSSFQLDGISRFRPQIGVLLNITPDHLDRYNGSFEAYAKSKFRLTMNQSEDDYLIYDDDDPVIKKYLKENNNKIKAKRLPFSLEKSLSEGAYLKDKEFIVNIEQEQFNMRLKDLALQGKHNTKNMMAAALAAKVMKVRNQDLYESLQDFEGVEHRLEKVLKINGVQYINDSKATNINATFYALESMDAPTVWIVGGVDKGNDYEELMPLVREKVKSIVCLGLDNKKIATAFAGVVENFVETAGAEEAVKVAYKLAEKGDNVLLSPACASFDLFESYEDRGRKFKEAVRTL